MTEEAYIHTLEVSLEQKERELLKVRDSLVWTHDTPKVMGWYWVLPPNLKRPQIVKLCSFDLPMENWSGWANSRWAGPIPEPPA